MISDRMLAVSGISSPEAENWIGRSIAAAAGHPIGVGDARYRFTDQAGIVDTVPFGAFRRDLIDRIGSLR